RKNGVDSYASNAVSDEQPVRDLDEVVSDVGTSGLFGGIGHKEFSIACWGFREPLFETDQSSHADWPDRAGIPLMRGSKYVAKSLRPPRDIPVATESNRRPVSCRLCRGPVDYPWPSRPPQIDTDLAWSCRTTYRPGSDTPCCWCSPTRGQVRRPAPGSPAACRSPCSWSS